MTFAERLDWVVAHGGAAGLAACLVGPLFVWVALFLVLPVALYRRASARGGRARQARDFDEAERQVGWMFRFARIVDPLRQGHLWAGATLDLALVRQTQERSQDAAKLCRQALAALGTRFHGLRGIAFTVLGELELVAGRHESAEHYLDLAVETFKSHWGKPILWHGVALLHLSRIALRGERHGDAARLAPESSALLEASLGREHLLLADSLMTNAALELRSGRRAQAEALVRRVVEIHESRLEALDRRRLGGLRILAVLLLARNRVSEADQLLARVAAIEAGSRDGKDGTT